ncbi:hypothetical protein HYT05_00075 [Candidatus Kaiserbacteria bacterium]|nr:hypothetical protein [Candidatus Kaiserbacteria bacterium]
MSNEDRFRKWFDEFVFNERNDVFKTYKREINCDSYIAWKLRSSLLHFYGFPKLKNEYIGFATLDVEMIARLRAFVRQTHPKKHVRVINPYRLIEAVISGLLTQLETLQEMIKGKDEDQKEMYIRGIVKCYEIIDAEGAIFLPYKQASE